MLSSLFSVWSVVSEALVERGEPATAHGLHDPNGDAALTQELHLILCALERPIHIVELDAAEFRLGEGIQKALDGLKTAMCGKTEVTDAAGLLLRAEKSR